MKPNIYGAKFYMTCCAETAYCSRYGYFLSCLLRYVYVMLLVITSIYYGTNALCGGVVRLVIY
jgi:hypothetical protein